MAPQLIYAAPMVSYAFCDTDQPDGWVNYKIAELFESGTDFLEVESFKAMGGYIYVFTHGKYDAQKFA